MGQKIQPRLPKGTRDFSPAQVLKRQYIINIIKDVFEKFGFEPLETPAMENLSVLTGKYGEEGDQLLFKILDSGDYLAKVDKNIFKSADSRSLTPQISEKGLRYDLTVPFARYVSANRNDIVFPFKRYQIQPVWRADRPQKGRFREFYQCDADVIGTDSLLCEAEVVMMINEVMDKLKLQNYLIKVNNRKILEGICETAGLSDHFNDAAVAIDKLDKIGEDGVKKEMTDKGFDPTKVEQLLKLISLSLEDLKNKLTSSETGNLGINEVNEVFSYLEEFGNYEFDASLARGLSYYTGCIFEVVVHDVKIGSISGGGRYDNLTEDFGLKDVSGVGFSFGLDRIYEVLEEMNLFPETLKNTKSLLLIALDRGSFEKAVGLLTKLRKNNIPSELYPDVVKLKKSMNYANNKNYKYVIIIGEEEINTGMFSLKNMISGDQQKLSIDDIIKVIING